MKKLILFAIGLSGLTASLLAGPVADPGSRGIDWDRVRQKATRHKWAGDIVEGMKKEVRAVMSRYEHPPLGTTGWFRSSAAHNMLVVDGKRQANCGGYLVSYEHDKVCAGVKDAYDGVDIRRRVMLLGNGIEDVVEAESDNIHRYDLFYHVRGRLQSCNVPLSGAEPFKESNGYNMLKDLRKVTWGKQFETSWALRDAPGELRIRCNSPETFDFYIGTCPDNPADKEMGVLMLRKKGIGVEWNLRVMVAK